MSNKKALSTTVVLEALESMGLMGTGKDGFLTNPEIRCLGRQMGDIADRRAAIHRLRELVALYRSDIVALLNTKGVGQKTFLVLRHLNELILTHETRREYGNRTDLDVVTTMLNTMYRGVTGVPKASAMLDDVIKRVRTLRIHIDNHYLEQNLKAAKSKRTR